MNPQRVMLYIFGFILVVIGVYYASGCPGLRVCPFFKTEKDPPMKVYLSFVGTDAAADWKNVISKYNAYKKQEKNEYVDVIVSYERIDDLINYEDEIQQRQFDKKGPNIYMIFHTWIPRYKDRILPLPSATMSFAEFKNTFARVAVDDLTQDGETIYSLPFYIDTPALYYTDYMFLNENLVEAPKNWREFESYVVQLTDFKNDEKTGQLVLDENGNRIIDRAGAAFGGGSNVHRSQDIVMLLMMQNNYDEKNLVSFNNPGSATALKFYADFTDPASRFYTWNEDQMFSIDAFTQRKSAMMIDYSDQIKNIESKTGGTLDFKIAPIPQLNEKQKVNYASYWTPVVADNAPCRAQLGLKINCYDLAWEFLNFASQKSNAKLYLDSSERAAANLELALEQSLIGDRRSVFASQVFTARTWHNPDNALADEKLLEMINAVVTGDKEKKLSIDRAMDIPKRYIAEINR
ncbi:MAG: extracellular solute-binding protein [Minisyncoccia bacterium]